MDTPIPEFLAEAANKRVSDIFIIAGRPLAEKIDGHLFSSGDRLMPAETEALLRTIYTLAENRDISRLLETGDDDFSFSIPGVSRFRVNAYKQRGSLAAVIRVIAFRLPDPAELSIPEDVMSVSDYTRGMVLITGSAGSGKSTTMACLIDRINHTREGHIITLEDPLEYLHRHDKCIVSQREICTDTESYLVSLRATLRQSPDVILLGEMRDHETISIAMTAAETGHPDTGESSTEELTALIFERAVERYKTLEVRDEDIRSEEMKETLAGREEITEFDEELYRKLIKQILVYKDNSVKVIFHNNNSIKIGYGEE